MGAQKAKRKPPATQSVGTEGQSQLAQSLRRAPLWALALALVAVPLVLIVLVRGCVQQLEPMSPSQLAASAATPPAVLKAIALNTVDPGAADYRQISISGLSHAANNLTLWGTVRMPTDRYADQFWQVSWVSDDVVGEFGLDVTDPQIQWYPVTGESREEDADGVLATWGVTQDTRCLLHIRVEGKAGVASEKVYATFDIGTLRPSCVK